MDVRSFTVGPVAENAYIFRLPGSDRGLMIDPGEEAPRLLAAVEEMGIELEAILLTHTHFDHIGAVAPVAKATGAPVYCPELEVPVLADINSFVPWPETRLAAGDHLQLEGDPSALLKRQGSGFLEIVDSAQDGPGVEARGLTIGEVALAPGSRAIGTTLEESAFSQHYGVTVLGLRRNGRHQVERLSALRLEQGDVLLVRGSTDALVELAHNPDFLVVNRLEHAERDHARRLLALGIMGLTVALAALGLLHVSVAALLGMLLMVAAGCMPVRDIYRHVDWRVVFMIAAMMPLSLAMDEQHTGAGRWIADGLLALVGGSNPQLALLAVMLLTVSLTQVMSNAACVVLVAPVAIATAVGLGVSPHPFAMAVAIAASTSFITPIAHQANLLVYGVGNYRFGDFVRVGGPLAALILLASLWLVPAVWPFHP